MDRFLNRSSWPSPCISEEYEALDNDRGLFVVDLLLPLTVFIAELPLRRADILGSVDVDFSRLRRSLTASSSSHTPDVRSGSVSSLLNV